MRLLPIVALILAGCGSALPFEPAGPDAAPAPSTFGPFPVGVRTYALADASRTTAGRDGPRNVITEVWYPATDDARDQLGAEYTLRDVMSDEAIRSATITADVHLRTDAVRDATPRAADGPYPVVFFSHGSNGIRMQSLFLTIYLASHGYVVIAPDHEGNVLSDLITDRGIPDAGLAAALFFLRPDDIRFLMEHFRAIDAGDPLHGLLDFEHVGMVGHSFGALTAVRVGGLADPGHPVDVVVAQAPPKQGLSWLGIEKPLSALGAPLLIEGGDLDGTTPGDDARTYWPEAAAPKMELMLSTAGHFTYSDLCRLDPTLVAQVVATGVGDALDDGCGPANIAPEAAYALIRHFTIGAFNTYLRGSPGSRDYLSAESAKAVDAAPLTFRAEL